MEKGLDLELLQSGDERLQRGQRFKFKDKFLGADNMPQPCGQQGLLIHHSELEQIAGKSNRASGNHGAVFYKFPKRVKLRGITAAKLAAERDDITFIGDA